MSGPRILVIEDDDVTRSAVAGNLVAHDYAVDEAADAGAGLRAWDADRPDLILLDLGLPDRDGLSVIRHVRREAATPILVLSARGQEADKIGALEAGADDYVTKPFGIGEVRARVAALLRRAGQATGDPAGVLRNGSILLDPARRRRDGQRARSSTLTPREYELLKQILAAPGPGAHPRPAAARRVGHRLRRGGPLPPRLRVAAAAEARGRGPGRRRARRRQRRAGRRLPRPGGRTRTDRAGC